MNARYGLSFVLGAGLIFSHVAPVVGAPVTPGSPSVRASADASSAKPKYVGSPPLWVQMPYLQRSGKRFVLLASAYIEPSASNRKKRLKDQVTVELMVAKPGKSTPKKPRALAFMPRKALLTHVKRRVPSPKTAGVQTFSFTFGKKVSRSLAGQTHRQRLSSVGMTVTHRRDTTADPKPVYDLRQVTPAELVKKKLSPTLQAERISAIKRQIRRDQRRSKSSALAGAQLARWAGQSPMYNQLNVQNSSPFTQMVNINPNIQCMWTGADPSAALYTSASDVAPGETVSTTYIWTGSASVWAGLQGATSGMNAPGTASTLTEDLSNAAVAAGQSGLSEFDATGFNEAGLEAAVGSAAGAFLKSMFTQLTSSTCNTVASYPELFGVTTTVTGYGFNNAQDPADASWPAPSSWAGTVVPVGSAVSPTTSNLQSCDSSTDSAPTGAPSQWCGFVYGTLAPMMGATTQATYYWNGGQAAYMVSNNASENTYTGGAAAFQGALFQSAAPNPGSPGTAWCQKGTKRVECDDTQSSPEAGYIGWATYDYGVLNVQLSFLSTPDKGSNGIVITGTPTVTATMEPSGGVNVLQVSCHFNQGMSVDLKLPFASGGTSQDLRTTVANTKTLGGEASMNWVVSFYGVDDSNELVYDQDSVTAVSPNEPIEPNIGPGTEAQIVGPDTNSSLPSGGIVSVQVQPGVTWVNLDGDAATPVSWGCSATPVANFQGVNITEAASGTTPTFANFFGTYMGSNGVPINNGWPMPGNHYGWPVGPQYGGNTNYSWQWPVDEVNVSWTGLSVAPVTLAPAASP